MASKQPIVKQIAWSSLIPHLLILSIFIVLASQSDTENPAIIGALVFFSVGEGERAREFYKKTLLEFPDSAMAKAAIRMLDSAVQIQEPGY
jgi:hypothetical protein